MDTSTATLSADSKPGLTHIAMLVLINLHDACLEPNLKTDVRILNPPPFTVTVLPPKRGPLFGTSKYTFAQELKGENNNINTMNLLPFSASS